MTFLRKVLVILGITFGLYILLDVSVAAIFGQPHPAIPDFDRIPALRQQAYISPAFGREYVLNDFLEAVCAAIARIPDRLSDRHFVSQGFWLDSICRARLDFVGHLEGLSADWPEICRRIGREVELPQLNSSAAIAFSPPISDGIKLRYAADFERFNYAT